MIEQPKQEKKQMDLISAMLKKSLTIGGLWNETHSSDSVPEHVPQRKFNMILFVGELQASVLAS